MRRREERRGEERRERDAQIDGREERHVL